ncbi:MAG TPA: hypothetical protein VK668_22695 [Mucilaginibacter sp.]|nr:hypothetical protein [Mucilaginibacter sp.]
MNIQLTSTEFNYLILTFFTERPDFRMFAGSDNVLSNIDEDVVDEIRDWAGERLQKVGFDENYDLNQEGVILDSIVDKLYIG